MVIIHHSKNKISEFPVMEINWKSDLNNTKVNLRKFIQDLKKTPQYLQTFEYETGKIEIWFVLHDDQECKVSMYNTDGSCTIQIDYISSSGQISSSESHKFNPFGFQLLVNSLLRPEDLEKQTAVRDQKTLRREELKKAHDTRKCTGSWETCEFCASDERWHQVTCGYGT